MSHILSIFQIFIDEFIEKWIDYTSPSSILHITLSEYPVFSFENNPKVLDIKSSEDLRGAQNFDLIIGDLPFGMMIVEYNYHGKKLKIPNNWKEIIQSIEFLSQDGTALYVLEPLGFGSERGRRFEAALSTAGFYVSGYLRLPQNVVYPQTRITPILAVISRRETPFVFVAEMDDFTAREEIVKAYFKSDEHRIKNPSNYILPGTFHGFSRLRIQRQLERLELQYENYTQWILGNLATEINSVPSGGTFVEIPNSIYIPKIGRSPVVSNLKNTTLKHQNYFQVALGEGVNSAYVAAFFRTTLGRQILNCFFTESYISHLNKSEIKKLPLAIPKPEEQASIVNTMALIARLKESLNQFDSELALNLKNANSIQPKLESMLSATDGLTEVEKINALIRGGESKRLEFKATLSLDVETQTKEKYLETSVLKTITAFINSEGGVLLIGVSDEGIITGLNQEIKKFDSTADNLLKRLKNLIKRYIGEPFYPFIDYRLIDVDGKKVLFVECQPSPELECYLDNRDFYVRINPATDKLEGPELVKYIRNRFHR